VLATTGSRCTRKSSGFLHGQVRCPTGFRGMAAVGRGSSRTRFTTARRSARTAERRSTRSVKRLTRGILGRAATQLAAGRRAPRTGSRSECGQRVFLAEPSGRNGRRWIVPSRSESVGVVLRLSGEWSCQADWGRRARLRGHWCQDRSDHSIYYVHTNDHLSRDFWATRVARVSVSIVGGKFLEVVT